MSWIAKALRDKDDLGGRVAYGRGKFVPVAGLVEALRENSKEKGLDFPSGSDDVAFAISESGIERKFCVPRSKRDPRYPGKKAIPRADSEDFVTARWGPTVGTVAIGIGAIGEFAEPVERKSVREREDDGTIEARVFFCDECEASGGCYYSTDAASYKKHLAYEHPGSEPRDPEVLRLRRAKDGDFDADRMLTLNVWTCENPKCEAHAKGRVFLLKQRAYDHRKKGCETNARRIAFERLTAARDVAPFSKQEAFERISARGFSAAETTLARCKIRQQKEDGSYYASGDEDI